MIITINSNNQIFTADLSKPIDISIPLKNEIIMVGTDTVRHTMANPNCFNAPPPIFTPVHDGDFIGDTRKGSPVNFYNIQINPHGNGTHTECVGHISKERYYINDCLQQFHSIGLLITIELEKQEGDFVIVKEQLMHILKTRNSNFEALIIRTLPNSDAKLSKNYSNTNPAYFTNEAMEYIVSIGVKHLIVDLPSVDKEKDGGQLAAHHIFWNYPHSVRKNATITEMVFIANDIEDGLYLVNHQIMPIELDASSSKIILYNLTV